MFGAKEDVKDVIKRHKRRGYVDFDMLIREVASEARISEDDAEAAIRSLHGSVLTLLPDSLVEFKD